MRGRGRGAEIDTDPRRETETEWVLTQVLALAEDASTTEADAETETSRTGTPLKQHERRPSIQSCAVFCFRHDTVAKAKAKAQTLSSAYVLCARAITAA
ncbi:hypothetical protein EW145_g8254 [Phellinidium pouzarii]|uniref:Uncharacterized protein n=1 Tax=Phellinidium pouzarii TaxID=167371 RepID=A0A4S4K8Y4_9AGAM|nr:hypothetical protein EW145_g8254 [Phellinidium pouzarii]